MVIRDGQGELEVESASSGERNLPDLVSAWDNAPPLPFSLVPVSNDYYNNGPYA